MTFASIVTFGTTQPARAFTLTQDVGGTSTPVPFQVTNIDYSTGATIVTLSAFSGSLTDFGSLSDGRYTLTTLANQVSINGQPLAGDITSHFFRYFGDVNGDASVDVFDLNRLAGTFGLNVGQPGFLSYLDFNGDGSVDIFDLTQFARCFGTVLP